jgi:LemA protein
MESVNITWLYVAGGVLLLLFLIGIYNKLVRKRNAVENTFGAIDAMLKKRYDLIPNLVATVKEYMKHEAGVLTEITELRSRAVSDDVSDEEKVYLDNQLSKNMGNLMVAVENYPDLKASENFIRLQAAWNETEEQISAARRTYNAVVTDYNNSVETFPTNLVAGMFGFKRKNVFEISEAERQNISAKDLFNA